MKTNFFVYRKIALLAACVCAVALASSHEAKALAIPDGHELGRVVPAEPEGEQNIMLFVNVMISLGLGDSFHVIIGPHDDTVTRSMNDFGTLPSPATLFLPRGTGTTIDLGTLGTFQYLFAHYGGQQGGTGEVWFVGDLSGLTTIPQNAFGHGLSGWALFTAPKFSVPDGGATAMLLGAAFGMFGVARRFLARRTRDR